MRSTKEYKVSRSGIGRLTTRPTRISFALVGGAAFISNFRALIIGSVLDPNVKDLYCRHCWETEQFDVGMGRLEEVVCDILDIFFQ